MIFKTRKPPPLTSEEQLERLHYFWQLREATERFLAVEDDPKFAANTLRFFAKNIRDYKL